MEKTTKEIIESLIYDLIYDDWKDETEQTLRSNLEALTHNPAAKIHKSGMIDITMSFVGNASQLRKEIDDNSGSITEFAADELDRMHKSILKDLNENFVL